MVKTEQAIIQVRHNRKDIGVEVDLMRINGKMQYRVVWPYTEQVFVFYDEDDDITWFTWPDEDREAIAMSIAKALSWELYRK